MARAAPPGPTQTPSILLDATGTRPISEPTGHIVQNHPYPTGMPMGLRVVFVGRMAVCRCCGLWGPFVTQPADEGLKR